MKAPLRLACIFPLLVLLAIGARADTPPQSPQALLSATLQRLANLIEPPQGQSPKVFTATLELREASGLPDNLVGQPVKIAYQAPDKLAIHARYDNEFVHAGRFQQELWIYRPGKNFGVRGRPNVPLFETAPNKLDTTRLEPFRLPISREQLALLPLLVELDPATKEILNDVPCHVLAFSPKPEAVQAFKLPQGAVRLWVRTNDHLPVRVAYNDANSNLQFSLDLLNVKVTTKTSDRQWRMPAKPSDHVEITALSHLTRFFPVVLSSLTDSIPPLGPATGRRDLVAREGQGRLERVDDTLVLFLKGAPEEMGRQHGVLMKKQVRDLVNHVLYGVGVGSSFEKGRWFFAEIQDAQARLAPFIDKRYLREMDAIAFATGNEPEEIRLANFFPELFHCSGFALFGNATKDGALYHGRVLDYLKGVGLEQNAVVMVFQPDIGNAWVNIGYAGFVGSVTAMNEKKIAIGEMGGRGEGDWDGKPMAQLIREVMESADTLEEAIEIMRRGPRTCEYFYVISDGNSRRAVGIAATPRSFETVWPGENHPQLPHAIEDAVLMSAGDRYETLAARVKEAHGTFNADSARDLMCRPVAMKSNIHSVLFAPETLDFWVANADSANPASHTRYTQYNLAELLAAPAITAAASQ